jgi:hypothetical protein
VKDLGVDAAASPLLAGHTPGPWRWEINLHSKQLKLCGGRNPYDLTVMDFTRWGMSGAKARFLRSHEGAGMLMHDAEDFAAIVPGREHHARWFQTLEHPDARLIAAAPRLLQVLQSIAANTCCDGCREAAMVAQAALEGR